MKHFSGGSAVIPQHQEPSPPVQFNIRKYLGYTRIISAIVAIVFFIFVATSMINNVPQVGLTYAAGSGDQVYQWTLNGNTYTLYSTINDADFQRYQGMSGQRDIINEADYPNVNDFITLDDPDISSIVISMQSMASQAGLSREGQANLVLHFVQSLSISTDAVTTGQEVYWRYPVETLYSRTGDGADRAVLYATLMEAMGYECVILFLQDHVNVGIQVGSSGSYYELNDIWYFNCEMSLYNYDVGEIRGGDNTAFIQPVGE